MVFLFFILLGKRGERKSDADSLVGVAKMNTDQIL